MYTRFIVSNASRRPHGRRELAPGRIPERGHGFWKNTTSSVMMVARSAERADVTGGRRGETQRGRSRFNPRVLLFYCARKQNEGQGYVWQRRIFIEICHSLFSMKICLLETKSGFDRVCLRVYFTLRSASYNTRLPVKRRKRCPA